MKPIFILAAGRSGSKLLRSFLSMPDNVYEVPFDIGYIWHKYILSNYHDFILDDYNDPLIVNNTRNNLLNMLSKKTKNNHSFFVEKSVSNSLNPFFVREVFPEAKIVVLIRNPFAVYESTMRVWDQKVSFKYALKKMVYAPSFNIKYIKKFLLNYIGNKPDFSVWGPVYNGMYDDIKSFGKDYAVAKQVSSCISNIYYFSKNDNNNFVIKYEDFIQSQNSRYDLLNYCDLTPFTPNALLDNFTKNIKTSRINMWQKNHKISSNATKYLQSTANLTDYNVF